MPKVDLDSVEAKNATGYPEPFHEQVQGRWWKRIAPLAGLTEMGASHVTLEPGAWSSQRHWHDGEDEMVVMLSGTAVLVEDDGETEVGAGDVLAWAKGVAVFFAVGAVSGTVLSLELGLLWPGFMRHAGPVIGLPFSWEGTAFFLEAIALGLFLYGWQRLPERVHFAAGVAVGATGVASGVLVVSANAWMNSPAGFDWVDGRALNVVATGA